MIRCYLAMKMGGLTPREIEQKSIEAKTLCTAYGIEGVSPWDKERVHYQLKDWDEPIGASKDLLILLTKLDKDEIRSCQAVIDIDGDKWSKGTALELGFNRYRLMRPTIFIDPDGYRSLRERESDYIAKDMEGACKMIKLRWGKRIQRIMWRLTVVWNPVCVWQRLKDEVMGWR